MAASGYITLPRELLENEELMLGHRLKVLMYLASNARWNYNPDTFEIRGVRVTINRGQFAESYIQMAIDVKIGKRQMLSVLSELEQCGFIKVDRSNVINVYTIVDYNKFCSSSTELQKGQQTEQQTELQKGQQTELQKGQPYNNGNNNVNKGEEINNCVYNACESEIFPSGEEAKWYAQMKRSYTAWQRDACRTLKIDQTKLESLIEDFEVECRTKSTTHISWANITSHFIDWGRRQVEKQRKQISYGTGKMGTNNNNPSVAKGCYEPTGAEDYSGDRF